jgi:hypothetical protein
MYAQGPAHAVARHPKSGDESDEKHKGLYMARQLSVFRNYRLVNFVDCVSGLGWCARRYKDVYWFEQNVSTSSSGLLVLPAMKFTVGVTKWQERDEVPGL